MLQLGQQRLKACEAVLSEVVLRELFKTLQYLNHAVGGCERIQGTPLPFVRRFARPRPNRMLSLDPDIV